MWSNGARPALTEMNVRNGDSYLKCLQNLLSFLACGSQENCLVPCKVSATESPGALENEGMSQDNGDEGLKVQRKKGEGGRKEVKGRMAS